MRVLVTGAGGLVGSHLMKVLAAAGHEALGMDRGHSTIRCDLTDARAATAALNELKPEAIVNCAAMSDVDACERDASAAWAVNAEAPATLARYVRANECHLVHLSTDYVFDGTRGPAKVDDVPNPRGVYASSKLAGELAVRSIAPAQRCAIARTAVVFSWPAVAGKKNFGSWLIDGLRAGQPMKLFSDQWITPTHAHNAAEMSAELATRTLSGTWHLSGAEVVDRATFGLRLCERFGFDRALVQPSRMADAPPLTPRPARAGLDVSLTLTALSARPWSLTTALDRLHAEVQGAS